MAADCVIVPHDDKNGVGVVEQGRSKTSISRQTSKLGLQNLY